MSTAIKSINKTVSNNLNNGCSPKNAILCCQGQNGITSDQKKVVKVVDPLPHKIVVNGNNSKPLKSPPPAFNGHSNGTDTTTTNSSTDASETPKKPEMKIIEPENAGIKLTDIGIPHISVQTIEDKNMKKTDKPQTTIIIYKPKNSNRAPTAKVIVQKVFNFKLLASNFLLVFLLFLNFPSAVIYLKMCYMS
jgi:hypothetical protein